jgi:predicted MFS family arabinose efflux permease
MVAFIVISTATFNLAQDPYQALLADLAAPQQRGKLTGLWMFFGAAGQVLLLVLPIDAAWKFGACAALMLVTTGITCALTREPKTVERRERPSAGLLVRDGIRALRSLKQARIYLIAFLLYGAGTVAVVPNLVLFIKYVTHCSDSAAQMLFMFLMLVTACATVGFGLAADRVGAMKLLLAGYVLVVAASIAGCMVRNMPQVAVALFIAGLGIACQNASSYPLLIRLVPDEDIGLFAGLQTTALSIVEPLSAIATGHMINHFGYRSIFAVCAVWIAVAIAVLCLIRPDRAPAEIAQREAG